MNEILSYKQITDTIKKIVDNHLQIKSIFFTKEFNVEDGEKQFPLLVVYPNNIFFPNQNSELKIKEFNLTIKLYDLIDKENDNEIDLFSDIAQMIGDLITILSEHPDLHQRNAIISNSPLLTPIFNELDSNANGYETTITIRTINKNAYCQLPIKQINL